MLFSKEEWRWCGSFKKRHACGGYHVPLSVETGCLTYSSMAFDRKRSATNMFLSFDMLCARIRLFLESIATQSQVGSDPILITASSTMNSLIFFLHEDIFLWGYFWIHCVCDIDGFSLVGVGLVCLSKILLVASIPSKLAIFDSFGLF